MERNTLFLTLGGIALLGVGMFIGNKVMTPQSPQAYYCTDCGNFGDDFICSTCHKSAIDFELLEQRYHSHIVPPLSSRTGNAVKLPNPKGVHPRKHKRAEHFMEDTASKPCPPQNREKRTEIKILNNEHPINMRTGLPEATPPENLNLEEKPFPVRRAKTTPPNPELPVSE